MWMRMSPYAAQVNGGNTSGPRGIGRKITRVGAVLLTDSLAPPDLLSAVGCLSQERLQIDQAPEGAILTIEVVPDRQPELVRRGARMPVRLEQGDPCERPVQVDLRIEVELEL